jgi:hypothetical protein
MFYFLYHWTDFYRNWLYMWITRRVSYKKQELLTFASTWVHPRFYGGVRVAHLFSFLCCAIMCLYVPSPVLWCPLRFRIETMFGSSLAPVVCKRAHVLFTLCVFACVEWCLTHIVLCFGFVVIRLVWHVLPVLWIDHFFIVPSVFSNVY